MLDAVKFVRRLASMPALAGVIAEELRPGPGVASDEDLVSDIRQRSGTVYHPSCTCGMGPDPKTSVVDPRLRVHGIAGLRVMDASIFPSIISGNTNAPALMVGAHGAALLLEDES
jgi:choline dehydrogenase